MPLARLVLGAPDFLDGDRLWEQSRGQRLLQVVEGGEDLGL